VYDELTVRVAGVPTGVARTLKDNVGIAGLATAFPIWG
jgi:hypothetical protein